MLFAFDEETRQVGRDIAVIVGTIIGLYFGWRATKQKPAK